jgi:hypothetical protein
VRGGWRSRFSGGFAPGYVTSALSGRDAAPSAQRQTGAQKVEPTAPPHRHTVRFS